jgi:hypothetical protein
LPIAAGLDDAADGLDAGWQRGHGTRSGATGEDPIESGVPGDAQPGRVGRNPENHGCRGAGGMQRRSSSSGSSISGVMTI